MSYCIVYSPLIFDFGGLFGKVSHPMELFKFLNNNGRFDLKKQRPTMAEVLGMENYASIYIAQQARKHFSEVLLSDDKRRPLPEIIQENGFPEVVFITSMSANFPTAIASAAWLNQLKIPVVFGGIHVSVSPEDIDTFLREKVANPELISLCIGPGDSNVITRIYKDLHESQLKAIYKGDKTMEDGLWIDLDGIEFLPPMTPPIGIFKKSKRLSRIFTFHPTTPFVGCPYSCSFCSIGSLDKSRRRLSIRSASDFVDELEKTIKRTRSRYFFFLPDNILLARTKVEEILDLIIERNLKINFATQISIEIADNERLLRKFRKAGAVLFLIGFESLEIKNLELIGKHIVPVIKKSGLSVEEFYSRKIKEIQKYGISILAAFIFGLPYDYFKDIEKHTGAVVGEFCVKNNLSLQPAIWTDLPGSRDFEKSQSAGTFLYGKKGTWNYLLGLCYADLSISNKIPPQSCFRSPLVIFWMAYFARSMVSNLFQKFRSSVFVGLKGFFRPPSGWGRAAQFLTGFAAQYMSSTMYDKCGEGDMQRLFETEKDPWIKKMFGKVF